jgi:hypothetical protein
LVGYVDTGIAGTATVLATAGTAQFWRGLVLIPEPSSFALLGLGVAGMWLIRRRNI